jgi:predicted nucleic acid-binding protein
MIALDTNIWIYNHDTRDPVKQQKAQNLIATARPLVLPWQVGCEFVAVCKKLELQGFSSEDAWDALADMQGMAQTILLPTPEVWRKTRDLQQRFSLSHWDALLVAACLQGGVQFLYTEDMGGTAKIDTLAIVNPFVAASP